MPTFDFPTAPALNDEYTENGIVYTWDGVAWGFSGPSATSSAYVKKTGDAMSGELVIPAPNPTTPATAAHKKYVDETVATNALWQGSWLVASNVPDLDPLVALPLHGYSWTAVTVDPNVPELAPAGLPGIGGLSIGSNDTVVWNANTSLYEHIPTPLSASAMLVQDAPPAGAFPGQVWFDSDSGKQYVWFDDGTSQQWVQISGGGGANKAEVYFGDVAPVPTFSGELWWDTATGNMMINQAGTWVQTNVEEAPVDGTGYVRLDAGWVNSAASALPPAVTTNVVWETGWSGTMSFRHNATTVTVSLHNVKCSSAQTGTIADVKICAYPASVTAPWTTLTSANIRVCTDDNYTPSTRNVMIRAKADGIYMGLYSGAAAEDTVANDRITGSLSWSI